MLSWPEAREYCQALGRDVDLAVLDYLCHDYHRIANYILMEGKAETQHTPVPVSVPVPVPVLCHPFTQVIPDGNDNTY